MSNSDSSDSQTEREIFFETLGKSSKEERSLFLDGACFNRPDLRRRIEALLANHAEQDSFMEETALDGRVTLGDEAQLSEGAGTVIDRYRLLEKLGEGGFGSVWAAEQKEPVRRRIALKIIKLGMDTQQVVARFEAERQALALMDHPNIAKVFDAGATETGRPYFVMELVKGISITRYCDQEKLGIKDRLDLFIKACRAIQHAHQKGIIHRDIKPSNIMVTLHDGVPVPKVIDFGIAKATQQELTEKTIYTQYNQFIGTPAYMSPEQAEMSGLDIDTRSDIYSLGVLLYELLTGSTPFDAKELMHSGLDEMRNIIREREPVRPSTRLSQNVVAAEVTRLKLKDEEREKVGASSSRKAGLPSIPSDLDWIVMKCLEKDRARRYDSANGLTSDLKRHLNDEPVTACPPTAAYRFQKAFRRNKLVFTAGAAVFAALVIGISVSMWQTLVAWEAQKETKEAQLEEEKKSRENERLRIGAEQSNRESVAARQEAEHASYVSQVRLAAANIDQGDLRTAQDVLLHTASRFRNWEWGHLVEKAWPPETDREGWTVRVRDSAGTVADLWRDSDARAMETLEIQSSRNANAMAFRERDNQILNSPFDGWIHRWNAQTGKKIDTESIEASKSFITSMVLNKSEQLVAVGTPSGETILLNLRTGATLWETEFGNRKPVSKNWYSPDDRFVLVGHADGLIDVIDAEAGGLISSFTNHTKMYATDRSKELKSLHFLSDGRQVASASQDGSVRVWELETGLKTELPRFAPYRGKKGISTQAVNPANPREIATGDFDGNLFIWDRSTAKKTQNFVRSSVQISHISFSHDGSCLFVTEGQSTIRVLDREGTELATLDSPNAFVNVVLNRKNSRILTTSGGGVSRIWAPGDLGADLPATLDRAHDDLVIQAAFNFDETRIATASFDRTAKVWDTASESLVTAYGRHTNELIKVDFSPDGKQVASFSLTGKTHVWNANNGRTIYEINTQSDRFFRSIIGVARGLRGIFVDYVAGYSSSPYIPSPSGDKLVVNDGRQMLVKNAENGTPLFPLINSTNIGWPTVSPSGNLVAIMTDNSRNIDLWDANTGKKRHSLEGHKKQAFWAAFSHDSSRIVTGSMDNTAIVWDTATGESLATLRKHKGFISVARFSPTSDRIATSALDSMALISDATDGTLISTLKGSEQRTTNIEFNPDPNINRVLTTSMDNTVRVWDPEQPVGRELIRIKRNARLTYATWSPSGRMILSCWGDGVVQLHKTIPWQSFSEIADAEEMSEQIQKWRGTRLQ